MLFSIMVGQVTSLMMLTTAIIRTRGGAGKRVWGVNTEAVQCSAVLYGAVQCSEEQYIADQCSEVQFGAV